MKAIARMTFGCTLVAASCSIGTSVARGVLISDFESPDVSDYSYANGSDGWEKNLSSSGSGFDQSGNAVAPMPGFFGGHTGSDAIGTAQGSAGLGAGQQFDTEGDQYGYINAGGNRVGVVISDVFATAANTGDLYALTADFGRRKDDVNGASGIARIGFLVNYDVSTFDGAAPPTGTAMNSVLRSAIPTGSFVPLGSLAYVASAGDTLRAYVMFDNNGDSFEQLEFDNVSFTSVAAVPEPAAMALVGLAGVGAMARRRRSL